MSVIGVSGRVRGTGSTAAFLAAVVAGVSARAGRRRCRRELALLSDEQLRDCGIDPVLAGRGKAAAIDADIHRRVRCV